VQKAYLGVGTVLTSDEARELVNAAGGNLAIPGPVFGSPPAI
jgi:2-keto-3-deoxy-6-phosphogluconate aldolase